MSNDRPDFTWEEFAAGNNPPGDNPPPRDADRFKPCFRHHDRQTGITCQRCDRPICGECMRPASVGFQCPACVAEQAHRTPPVHNRFGNRVDRPSRVRLARGRLSTTIALMVVIGAVGLVDLVTGSLASRLLAFSAPLIQAGELWRPVTSIVVTGSALNLLIHLVFLYFVGRSVEHEIGAGRMLALLVLSGMGASVALLWLAPVTVWPNSFAAILGVLAGVAVLKLRTGEDIRGDLILLGLMVAFNLVLGSVAGWVSDLGGIGAGAAAGAAIAYAPRGGRTTWQVIGLAGIALLCVALTLVKVVA